MRSGRDALLAVAVRRVLLGVLGCSYHCIRAQAAGHPSRPGRAGLNPAAVASLRPPGSGGKLHFLSPTHVQCVSSTVTLVLLLLGGRGGGLRNPAQPHCQPAQRALTVSAANDGAELARLRQAYITAVRDSLTGVHLQTPAVVPGVGSELQQEPFAAEKRSGGTDWPL